MITYTFGYSPALEEEKVLEITNKIQEILAKEQLTLEQGEFILDKVKESINSSARVDKPKIN